MEKTDSKTSQNHGSGDEGGDREDEQATTSRGDNFSPEQVSHNMNDLKALDFNSADEVRQAMKLVLAGKMPPQAFTEQVKNNPEPVGINDMVQRQSVLGQDAHKTVQKQVQQTLYQKMKAASQPLSGKTSNLGSSKRKRGRPPKAGPSKQVKKRRLSSMYLGKLSNVVPFRRRWGSGSESDVDSVVIFY